MYTAHDKRPTLWESFEQQWSIHEQRLVRILELKKQTGIRVFPVVWKRWRSQPREIMPEEIQREQIRRILKMEVGGTRVDGLWIFGSEGVDSDIAYMRVIRQVADAVAHERNGAAALVASDAPQTGR